MDRRFYGRKPIDVYHIETVPSVMPEPMEELQILISRHENYLSCKLSVARVGRGADRRRAGASVYGKQLEITSCK